MTDEETDRSWWTEAKMNAMRIIMSDTEDQLDETVRKPTAEHGNTDNWKLGLVVNSIQIAVGVGVYLWFSGIVAWIGVFLAVLSAIAIIKWVLGL